MARPEEPIEKRLFRFTQKTEPCWIFKGNKSWNGYGKIWFKGRNHPAHRISYQIYKGEVPSHLFVLHHCDNPPCINPDHLFLGTLKDNTQDARRKGRLKGNTKGPPILSHCKKGHEFTPENIKKNGPQRTCRKCVNDRMKLWKKK